MKSRLGVFVLCCSLALGVGFAPASSFALSDSPSDLTPRLLVSLGANGLDGEEGAGEGEDIVPIDMQDASITVKSIGTLAYTKKAIKPLPAIKHDGVLLTRGVDYAISYLDDKKASVVPKAEGTYYVRVLGIGDSYTGWRDVKFKIAKTSISKAKMTVAKQVYTGKALTPSPTVKLDSKTLNAKTDYTVSYKNNTKVGTATVTVKGAGVYAGSTSMTFKISAASMSKVAIAGIAARTYSGSAQKPEPKVTFNKKALKKGTDYTVSWSRNVNAGTASVKVTGKGNFTGSKSASFRINRASVASASVGAIANATYSGRSITPSPAVRVGNKTLKKGTDYTLSYRNNVNAGTAQVVVTGKGNYQGTRTVAFKIVKPAAPKPSASSTVYITKSGKKYHRDGCSSLRKSKIAISRNDAIKRGYDACKNCRP